MKTYFYEKPDGKIFACEEKEAYQVHNHKRIKYRQIGVSDGSAYDGVMESHRDRFLELQDQLADLEDNKAAYRKLDRQFAKEKESAIREAIDAEIEVARGNFEVPAQSNVTVEGGTPQARSRVIEMLKHG